MPKLILEKCDIEKLIKEKYKELKKRRIKWKN